MTKSRCLLIVLIVRHYDSIGRQAIDCGDLTSEQRSPNSQDEWINSSNTPDFLVTISEANYLLDVLEENCRDFVVLRMIEQPKLIAQSIPQRCDYEGRAGLAGKNAWMPRVRLKFGYTAANQMLIVSRLRDFWFSFFVYSLTKGGV